jgi:predicted PurR-regulated permease PerM
MGGKPKQASFIIIFCILAIIFLPTWIMIDFLLDEVKELKVSYNNGTLTIPAPTEKVKEWPIVGEKLYDTWQSASDSLEQTIVKYQDQLYEIGSKLAKGILSTASGLIQIMAVLIIAGIMLVIGRLGESILKFFRKVAGSRGDEFADVVMKTVSNVVKGVKGVALLVGLLHGILLMLAGVPYAGIWTLMIFVLAILQIPAIFVTVPIIIYLL